MAYKKLEEIPAYTIASDLGDSVWNVVISWDIFTKRTIGEQFTRAIDSIAANFAEGFGSYHKRVKIRYFYQARASVFEAAHWCKKAFIRNLLTKEQNGHIIEALRKLPREINYQIKLVSINLKT